MTYLGTLLTGNTRNSIHEIIQGEVSIQKQRLYFNELNSLDVCIHE